jgi:hypothetical protein
MLEMPYFHHHQEGIAFDCNGHGQISDNINQSG